MPLCDTFKYRKCCSAFILEIIINSESLSSKGNDVWNAVLKTSLILAFSPWEYWSHGNLKPSASSYSEKCLIYEFSKKLFYSQDVLLFIVYFKLFVGSFSVVSFWEEPVYLGWRFNTHKVKNGDEAGEGELVKACREEVRIINQTNGDREQVCRGNSLMEQKGSGMKMNVRRGESLFYALSAVTRNISLNSLNFCFLKNSLTNINQNMRI